MRSHLISRVVLRRFANEAGRVAVHNKMTGKIELALPDDIAYTLIDERIILELEKQWDGDIESQADKALNKLYDGGLLYVSKHIQTLKKLMALHYVRSKALLVLMKKFSEQRSSQLIEEVTAAYPEHRDLIKKKVNEDWGTLLESTIPKILAENISKVNEFMERHGLEIGHAPDNTQFLLGDIPGITMTRGGKIGVLNGVAISDADSFAMTMTPHHLATLKTNPETKKYLELTPKQVENANSKQIEHALEEYYSNPSY